MIESPMAVEALLAKMANSVPDTEVETVVCAINWTVVATVDGGVGLAATPALGRNGARVTAEAGSFAGRALRSLAEKAASLNPYERAIGLAAINAGANHRTDLPEGKGLRPTPDGTGTVVVGRFPKIDEIMPGATVLEIDPREPDDLPAFAAVGVVPSCRHLVLTPTAIVNGTWGSLLSLVPEEAAVSLVGPGVTLSPMMFKVGIGRLAGFVVEDKPGLIRAVSEGAGARAFRRYGRNVVLSSSGSEDADHSMRQAMRSVSS